MYWNDSNKIKPDFGKEVLIINADDDFYLVYLSECGKWYDTIQDEYLKTDVKFLMYLPEIPDC